MSTNYPTGQSGPHSGSASSSGGFILPTIEQDAARVVQRLSAKLSKHIERNDFFSTLTSEVRSRFYYDRLSLNLYDSDREFLTAFSMPDGTSVESFSNTRIAQNTIAWQAIQDKKPVVIGDLTSIHEIGGATSLASAGLKATICVPLQLDNSVIGTLHVSFLRQPDYLYELLAFLNLIMPTLSALLFVVLAREKEFRKNAMMKSGLSALDGADSTGRFAINERMLLTRNMSRVMSLASKVSKLQLPVLIIGETGTGKSMLARWLHANSVRSSGPFVKVNCPSIAPSLFESEMFGYAKGAFTGAYTNRVGRVELASKGTLFLDEIGELPPEMQSKLLQVIEEGFFERVGDSTRIGVDIRIFSATNIDLHEALTSGSLRKDLFYRLAPIILRLPPLRQRREDIPVIIDHFLTDFSSKWGMTPPELSPSILEMLCDHPWPGNIRELRNVACRLLVLSLDGPLKEKVVREALSEWTLYSPEGGGEGTPGVSNGNGHAVSALEMAKRGSMTFKDSERAVIIEALQRTHGRVAGPGGAADLLGLPRTTLQNKMRRLGIRKDDYRQFDF